MNLEAYGIPCTVLRVPANFPPSESEAVSLSGMGTPDLLGGYGMFSYFTDDRGERTRDVPGGRIAKVEIRDQIADCLLQGLRNSFQA